MFNEVDPKYLKVAVLKIKQNKKNPYKSLTSLTTRSHASAMCKLAMDLR